MTQQELQIEIVNNIKNNNEAQISEIIIALLMDIVGEIIKELIQKKDINLKNLNIVQKLYLKRIIKEETRKHTELSGYNNKIFIAFILTAQKHPKEVAELFSLKK